MSRIAVITRDICTTRLASWRRSGCDIFVPVGAGRRRASGPGALADGVVWSPDASAEELESCAPKQIYVDARLDRPPASVIRYLKHRHGTRVVLGGLALEHDDDPDWLLARLHDIEAEWARPDALALSVLPELKDPVAWLFDEAGRYEDDLTLADLARITDTHQTMLDIHVAEPDEWSRFMTMLPNARGLVLHHGPPGTDGRWPAQRTAEQVTALLEGFLRSGVGSGNK